MSRAEFIEEYYDAIMSGDIVACYRIKQVYEKLMYDLKHQGLFVFDEDLANRPIEFIETFCKQSQGVLGEPLKLMLFQKAKYQAIYGFVDKNTRFRKYREVLDIRGRKNGKTTELAATSIEMTVADGESGAENYFIATKQEQSSKGFNEAWNMIKQDQSLSRHIRKRKSDLFFDANFSFIKALASNVNGLDGLNSHCVIIDELAAIKNRDLYDLMIQSTSSRDQPLLTCISTNGFVRECIFDSQYEYACKVLDGKVVDDTFLPFIYELDDRDEWDKEECWIKANPGLGVIKKIEVLRGFVNKAKEDPAFKATVMVKDFCATENAATAWLRWEELYNPEKFEAKEMGFRYGIGSFDLAETTDLAAAKVVCKRRDDDKDYYLSMYWLPEENLNNKELLDQVPYLLWEKQGLLRVCPGNRINPYAILEWFIEVQDVYDIYIPWIGYDPWHVDASLLMAFQNHFGKNAMISVRQGSYTLSMPMKELKAELIAKQSVYNDHPIDKWCLKNLEVKVDINGNIQPVKGVSQTQKIDGAVAMIIVKVILRDKMAEYLNMI
ncbi:terminase large subunit [Acetobacterium woodii]|uniref:Prophage lambdaba04, terminase large subunit n=1 Tax=Acetobacterium woodii (strain ATCC 29683 / DSM 1030 / JCM 2381 / KCTC 1655 / WB1) TaxID=931626 RepID=H6LCC1_ACEWD|nr:terminase TerL endonuclease subunit [Acetobacterium woodii]AFA49834.1 putative prophage LambdaBa04 terminase large subunit [Acetobacterium woodii DSM 1030]AFA50236.1 prophage lambdaba04, terminase large subunit [Acetobacterium woodii DSM 1030]